MWHASANCMRVVQIANVGVRFCSSFYCVNGTSCGGGLCGSGRHVPVSLCTWQSLRQHNVASERQRTPAASRLTMSTCSNCSRLQ